MFCPETILVNRNHLYVVRHDAGDYSNSSLIPWRQRFNPLRVEVVFRFGRYPNVRRFSLNKDAILHRWVSDLTWRLWRERACVRSLKKARRQ